MTAEDVLSSLYGVARTGLMVEGAAPGLWRRYLALALDGLRPGARPAAGPAADAAAVRRRPLRLVSDASGPKTPPSRRAARLGKHVPRNRTVRFAVLGSSVQRAAASGYPSSRSSALKRRIIVGGLVLLSLVLITVSFRSSALDGAQGTAASILRPFEVAADRVSRPFRDAAGWAHGLADAKSENKKLRAQVDTLRQQLIQDESAVQENVQLKQALKYKGPPSLANFDRVHTAVLTNPLSAIDESITIAAGTDDGIAAGNVVITPQGLVGTVDKAQRERLARDATDRRPERCHRARPDEPGGRRHRQARRR